MPTCPVCDSEVPAQPGAGRPRLYCSKRCGTRVRVARYRAGLLPVEMRGKRWTRADGKRPITITGRPASSTDPGTWSGRSEVEASTAGDGLGVMLGDGLGCYDLDHVTDDQAREFSRSVPERIVFAERSMSGGGVHLFIEAPESTGWKREFGGMSVERYTRARFIRFTGDRLSV